MEFIRDNWEKIVDEETHKLYMNFDDESRIKHMKDWPQKEIDLHYKYHTTKVSTDYLGQTLA